MDIYTSKSTGDIKATSVDTVSDIKKAIDLNKKTEEISLLVHGALWDTPDTAKQRFLLHLALCCIDKQRKDIVKHLLTDHWSVVSGVLGEVLVYATLCSSYEVTGVLLQAQISPFVPTDVDQMCEDVPEYSQQILEALNKLFDDSGKISMVEGKRNISCWQAVLLRDDVKLLRQVESSVGFDRSLTLFQSESSQILPVHDACLFNATSCLKYLLQNQNYNFLLDESISVSSKKRKLTSLFCLTYTDLEKLDLLFEHSIFSDHLDMDMIEIHMINDQQKQVRLASFLHHVASAGQFPFLQYTMANVTGHNTSGRHRCIGSSTPELVTFLINKGIDKNSVATYFYYPAQIRPLTLLCTQVKAWLAIYQNDYEKTLQLDQHFISIFETMELLMFAPDSLTANEINPLHFLLHETVSMVDAMEANIFIRSGSDTFIRYYSEALYISKEIFSWLLKKGFRFFKIGNTVENERNIFHAILDFLERTEFLLSYCFEEYVLENYKEVNIADYQCTIHKILSLNRDYFVDILRMYHSYGGELSPNEALYELVTHPNRPQFDPDNICLEITLSQCGHSQYYTVLQELLDVCKLNPEISQHFVEYIEEKSRSPRDLVDLCRQKIWSVLEKSVPKAVNRLPLPNYMKKYIYNL